MREVLKRYTYAAISALFATWAIFSYFVLPELQIPLLVTLLFVACFLFFYHLRQIITDQPLYTKLACVLFAFFMVGGDSFKQYGSFYGIFGNPFVGTDVAEQLFEDYASLFGFLNGPVGNGIQMFGALCKGVGYYFIIKHTVALLIYGVRSFFLSVPKDGGGDLADRFFAHNAFVRTFSVMILAWLPYLIIKFPGAVCNDANTQIRQFLSGRINTHHPFFTTLLYGCFARFGEALGDRGIGIFLLLLLQYVFMAAVFSYCIVQIQKLFGHSRFALFVLGLYAFSPAFPSFATTVIKDALYCTLFVLFIVLIIELLHVVEERGQWKRPLCRLVLISSVIIFTRNNGIYVVLPTLFVIAIWFVVSMQKNRKAVLHALLLLLPLFLYMGSNVLQYDILKLEHGSIAEALSIPFQQTARFVRDHPEDVTAEDAAIIDNVLDFEHLAQLYDPIVSDPVKATYKGDPSALGDYFSVWWKHLKMHLGTYIEATAHTNYVAFYPDRANIRAYLVMDGAPEDMGGISTCLRILLLAFVMGLSAIPVVSCLINPVFYVWIFLWLLFRFVACRDWVKCFVLLPLFIQLLTVIAGPAVFNHLRYIYPVYWSIPFILMFAAPVRFRDKGEGGCADKV